MTLPALAVALALSAPGGGLSGAAPHDLLDVPFLSQGWLLCGGAAAAMVERFHGRRGVYPDDYAHLLRPDEGGIRTTELAAELRRRGLRTTVTEHDPDAWRRALARGLPPILLIESGRDRYHYVVVVGTKGDTAFVHDPLVGPGRAMSVERLDGLHGPARRWTLVAEAPAPRAPPVGEPGDSRSGADATWAETLAPAMEALRGGEPVRAERLALETLPDAPSNDGRALAWRLVATARFRDGRTGSALDAWNRAGEPRIDLIRLEGLRTLRWMPLEARLPFGPRDLLTRDGLALAARRVESAPGVRSARVDYRPLPDGSVEVTGYVAEARRWPGRLDLARGAADALLEREAYAEIGPLLAGSERWTVGGRWLESDRSARLALEAPTGVGVGVARAELAWRRQRFASAGPLPASDEERTRGVLGVGEWITATSYAEARVGLERWSGLGRRAYLGAALRGRVAGDRLSVDADTEAWPGASAFGRTRLRAAAELPAGAREWRARIAGTAVYGTDAPRSLWDGAGVGRVREPLLRSRRLVGDDGIGGPAFGPRLVQGSLEHAFTRPLGPLEAALVLFADGARAWGRGPAGDPPRWLGAWGLQFELEADGRRLAVSLGTGGGDWVLSARVVELRP